MKTIGVIANCGKPDTPSVLKRLARKAAEMKARLVSCDETADLEPSIARVSREEMVERIEVLIAMGGDGTMLRAVRLLGPSETPVLGVNIGSLGFMTSIPEEQLEHAMDVLKQGNYTLSERSLAACRVLREKTVLGEYQALNDIVVGWGESSRVVTLGIAIDGEEVTQYVCDGLIVSTPTGSTGHSLSAGGPIVHPGTCAFVVNPICPHTLSNRPLVVADTCQISIEIMESPKHLLFAVDGQEHHPVEEADRLMVRRSPRTAHFILLPEYSYFSVLRQKLHWRGSAV